MGDAGLLRVTYDGTTLTFRPDEIVTIGRHPDAALHIAHRRVSRRHAVLSYADDTWLLTDEGSANGTFIGKERVTRHEVRGRVQIALGDPSGPLLTLTPAGSESEEQTYAALGSSLEEPTGWTRTRRRPGRVIAIGRAPDNDVVVDDPTVSWHHAEIRTDSNDDCEIVDLGSHNGTYLNGERIARETIRELDRVTVGDHSFRFREWTLEPIS